MKRTAFQFFVQLSACSDAEGRFVIVWGQCPEIWARRYDASARPFGAPFRIAGVASGSGYAEVAALQVEVRAADAQRQPLATADLAGDLVVLWVEETGGYEEAMLYAQRLEALPGCAPVALHGGRFELRTVWRSSHAPERGCAQGRATGSPGVAVFSFGGTGQDLQVTIYDARRIDGHFWVLSTNTSDFEHALTVIDRASGRSKTYFNPAFEPGARSDRLSFPG